MEKAPAMSIVMATFHNKAPSVDISTSLEVEISLERSGLFGQEIGATKANKAQTQPFALRVSPCRHDVLLVLAKGRSGSRDRDTPLSLAHMYLLPAYQFHHRLL